MKIKVKFAITAIIEFTVFTFLVQLANQVLYEGIWMVIQAVRYNSLWLANILSFISFTFLVHLFPYFFMPLLLRKKVSEHYMADVPEKFWIKSALVYMLPGEILRFISCLLRGHTFSGLTFARGFHMIYANTYRIWSRRYDLVFSETSAQDYIALISMYLVYLILHMAFLMFVYRHYWKKADKEHQQWLENRKTQSEY